jgi:GrpB-like predicted nucleotidyltransferase (UPF0157 family)
VPDPTAVRLVPYDPDWPRRFEEHAHRIRSALGDVAVGVEHMGSTSVPGLAAKDVIDIQIQVRSFEPMAAYRAPLEAAGYVYRPDDDPEHRFFKMDVDGRRAVNIHVVEAGGWWGRRDLAFRDYLRAHPDEAARYEAVKRELAERHPDDVQEYANAKTEYITGVHEKAGREHAGG